MATTVVPIDLVEVSALIGAALPVVAAVLKQDRLSQRTNTVIAVALAIVAAFVTAAARHQLGVGNLAASFTATYTTAVAFYHGLWKPTGVAPTVQTRTSPRRGKRPPSDSGSGSASAPVSAPAPASASASAPASASASASASAPASASASAPASASASESASASRPASRPAKSRPAPRTAKRRSASGLPAPEAAASTVSMVNPHRTVDLARC